jgi:oligopeptidase B
LLAALAACGGSQTRPNGDGVSDRPTPPVADKQPAPTTLHGDTRVDDYAWMRDKESPKVVAYLEAENAYADAILAPTAALQETLYKEIKGRIKQTDLSVPVREGGYYYYSRTEDGKQYDINCRKRGSLDAPSSEEEIILDENELAKGHEFLGVGAFEVTEDGNLLAYSIDTTGFRSYTLRIKDLRTGETLPDSIDKVKSVAWADQGKTLLYTVDDDTKRSYRLYRHTLGADPANDELLFEESDERFRIGVERSRSDKYLFLYSASHTATEVYFAPANDPKATFEVIAKRSVDHEYTVDHRGDRFYILTNDKGRNFRVVTAPETDPSPGKWTEIIPHGDDVMLEGFDVFANHYVVTEREAGIPHLRFGRFDIDETHRVEFPEAVYAVFGGDNPEFDTDTYRLSYQSFVTPSSIYDYHATDRRLELLKETEVLGGYDRTAYKTERLAAKAPDGKLVPISVVYKTGVKLDGTAPMFLQGYGSYGFSYPVTFSHARVSLLDRGVIVAVAHIRGGGEMGKKWHDDGRMFNKRNTFTDFIAVAEHLIAENYTASDRLAVQGGSAGGLLMGAVVNLRPDLFKAVLNQVPFVDVLNTMLDEDLPLTVGEFEEWGNPKIKDQYEYIKSYCPYSNLSAQAYPAMLVKTSFNDSQVMYWEPAKYVARMRALKSNDTPLLFKTNMAGGHGGSSGRYDQYRETAYDYAFILWQLGVAR